MKGDLLKIYAYFAGINVMFYILKDYMIVWHFSGISEIVQTNKLQYLHIGVM